MKNKQKCRKCKSPDTKKSGFRQTQNRGKIQRYKCKSCGFRFVADDGFFRMRNKHHKITLCLDLFYRGVSTRKIQEHLQSFYPENSSWVSIYSWIIKYSKLISKFTDKLKLNVGKEIQVDELEFKRRKNHRKKGIEYNWFVDSIDTTTRFMVSSGFVKSRSQKKMKARLKDIKERTNGIKVITTDGHKIYEKIVKKTFGYDRKLKKYNIIHNRIVASDDEGFNHPIERLHNTIRHRTKTFRGFHGNLESANTIMKGIEIYYNFITKHQAINCCPYELATDLKLKSPNKWLELIKISNKSI